jgi:hypothetical protein
MLFFWLVVSRCSRQPSAPQLMMTCVCRSSPVTMLPTVRSAGTSTDGDWCLQGQRSHISIQRASLANTLRGWAWPAPV